MESFQSDEPQIHRLYCEMVWLLLRLVKKEKIQNLNVTELQDVDLSRSNQLQDSEISVGEGTKNCLKKCSEPGQKKCLLGMQSISFWFHSFLSSKEIAIQKQASCKFMMFKSSEHSFVQTIRHWTDCQETVCIRCQYSEGNRWMVSVIYRSIYPFPFLQKSGSFLHLISPRSILQ